MSTDLSSLSASNEASLEQLSIYTAWLQNEIEMAKARNQGQRSWKVIERVWSVIPSQPRIFFLLSFNDKLAKKEKKSPGHLQGLGVP